MNYHRWSSHPSQFNHHQQQQSFSFKQQQQQQQQQPKAALHSLSPLLKPFSSLWHLQKPQKGTGFDHFLPKDDQDSQDKDSSSQRKHRASGGGDNENPNNNNNNLGFLLFF
jgi:hypothetical protein